MKTLRTRLEVVQNLSLLDRALRLILTAALLGTPVIYMITQGAPYQWWHGISWLLSIYFGLTAFTGWDPFYRVAGVKTCELSERNQCGTLPYQIDAALGHHPVPKRDFDHSLAASRHPDDGSRPANGSIRR